MSSIHDVAKQAGVSVATVSRTFASPNLIKEETQQRVLEVARQLNYQPRRMRARGVNNEYYKHTRFAASNAIGFQFFALTLSDTLQSNAFYASMFAGAQAEASALGMHLLVHTTDRHSLSQEVPRMVLERAVGGMLLVGTADPTVLSTFAQHIPDLVLLDNHDEEGLYESIVSDGFGGAYRATRYLLELGHRRIGFYLPEQGVATFQDRQRGYWCALLEAGIPPDPALVLVEGSPEETTQRMARLMTLSAAPTALITANDMCAFKAMRVLRGMDLLVPRDVSIVGFDDIAIAMQADVPLTTVHVDKEFMGRLAVRCLQNRMQTAPNTLKTSTPVRNVVPVTLIPRDSCRRVST